MSIRERTRGTGPRPVAGDVWDASLAERATNKRGGRVIPLRVYCGKMVVVRPTGVHARDDYERRLAAVTVGNPERLRGPIEL